MTRVIVTRIVSSVLVLLALIAFVFILRQASRVDPARAIVGARAPAAVVAAERKKLGLDDPLPVQYVHYVGNILHGDLGESAVTRDPIIDNLRTYLPRTLELIAAAFSVALVLGIAFALATTWKGAGTVRFTIIAASSLPVFLTALLGIMLFYAKLHWLPATGQTSISNAPTGPTGFLLIDGLLGGRLDVVYDGFIHLVLPAICLALGPAVSIGRILRSSLQQTLRSDYVRTARATGQSELRVLYSHALRNSAGPALSIGGLQVAALFGSVLVVEDVFAWPGLGTYTVQAINVGDFPTISAVTLTLGALYVAANLLVDVLQVAADPRIRDGSRAVR